MKIVKTCPITITDVYRAAKIWGPEIAYLKGTTRNVKTSTIPVEHLPRPLGRAVLAMHVDLMYVEREAFLYSKTTPLGLRMASHLETGRGARTTSSIGPRLEYHIRSYKSAGFEVGTLLSDREGGALVSTSTIQSKSIIVNPPSAGKHNPVIEKTSRR